MKTVVYEVPYSELSGKSYTRKHLLEDIANFSSPLRKKGLEIIFPEGEKICLQDARLKFSAPEPRAKFVANSIKYVLGRYKCNIVEMNSKFHRLKSDYLGSDNENLALNLELRLDGKPLDNADNARIALFKDKDEVKAAMNRWTEIAAYLDFEATPTVEESLGGECAALRTCINPRKIIKRTDLESYLANVAKKVKDLQSELSIYTENDVLEINPGAVILKVNDNPSSARRALSWLEEEVGTLDEPTIKYNERVSTLREKLKNWSSKVKLPNIASNMSEKAKTYLAVGGFLVAVPTIIASAFGLMQYAKEGLDAGLRMAGAGAILGTIMDGAVVSWGLILETMSYSQAKKQETKDKFTKFASNLQPRQPDYFCVVATTETCAAKAPEK
jgi:hypothetical protein